MAKETTKETTKAKGTMSQPDLGDVLRFGWQLRTFKKEGDEMIATLWTAEGEEAKVAVAMPIKPEPKAAEESEPTEETPAEGGTTEEPDPEPAEGEDKTEAKEGEKAEATS